MDKSGILLASGGLDSTTLAFWLISKKIEFVPLFIDYGQHCNNTELQTLRTVLPEKYLAMLEVVDLRGVYKYSTSKFIVEADLWEQSIEADDLYIPYRNILMLTVAASVAQTRGLSYVYSAFINSNHAKEIDCSSEFFNRLEVLLSEYGSVSIQMPFRNLTKYEVAKLGIDLKAPIGKTFSCQASSTIPCGACPNCVDRLQALRKLEVV